MLSVNDNGTNKIHPSTEKPCLIANRKNTKYKLGALSVLIATNSSSMPMKIGIDWNAENGGEHPDY